MGNGVYIIVNAKTAGGNMAQEVVFTIVMAARIHLLLLRPFT